jgi:hypothetical protein
LMPLTDKHSETDDIFQNTEKRGSCSDPLIHLAYNLINCMGIA